MTNCFAPYNESKSMYNGYNSLNLLNTSIGFVIPIYENMPEYPVASPAILASDFKADNTKVYAKVSTTLNVRVGPSTSYEILTSINANDTFIRIGQGIQNGERWDKVLLNNGMIGYVFQSYIEEYVEDDEIYFEFDKSVVVNNNEISSIKAENVAEFKNLINTNLSLEIYNNLNELVGDNLEIGTGYRLCAKNSLGEVVKEFYFIIYGDVNGDAQIDSLDALVLQKYILEIRQLDELFLKAGNISKNGELPSALDVLKIQKHIMEIKFIEQ